MVFGSRLMANGFRRLVPRFLVWSLKVGTGLAGGQIPLVQGKKEPRTISRILAVVL